jgi:hypothetical protein
MLSLVGEELPEDLRRVQSEPEERPPETAEPERQPEPVHEILAIEPDTAVNWPLVYQFIEKQYDGMLLGGQPTRYASGNINKVSKAWHFKSTYMIDPSPHIISFKLYDSHLRKETNYGFLFAFEIDKIQADIYRGIYSDNRAYIYGNYAFTHFNFSASLLSCDGEYRANLIRWVDMDNSKKKFSAVWQDLEEYISGVREQRGWVASFGHFSPHIGKYDETIHDIDHIIRTEAFMLTFLSASWFNFIINQNYQRVDTHINVEYKEIFMRNITADLEFLSQLTTKHTPAAIGDFHKSLTSFYTRLNDVALPERGVKIWCNTGFKMIPLNMSENQHCFNLHYKPWREYFAINKMSDLVINGIAPGVPLFGTYYYIGNSKKNLYDNKTQYLRLKNSEIAQEILKSLHEAQRGTYWVTNANKKTDRRVKSWISNKFKKLDDKIQTPIEYATREIIMSDASLMFIVEHVGITFSNVFVFLEQSQHFKERYGALLTDAGYPVFAKYIFNICFTLMSLNDRLGIMHGDLHLNNATINFGALRTGVNSNIVYDTYGPRYIFPHNYINSFLIDFSRVIFDTEKYNLLADLNLPRSHKMFDNFEEMAAVDKTELLNLYITVFPQKERVREELLVLFKKHFDAVFKLLSQLDIYMFSLRLLKLFEHIKSPMGKKMIALIDSIYKMSERSVTYDMNQLLDDQRYSEKIMAEPSRYQMIIEKNFSEFIFAADDREIGEYYNIKNEFRFSTSQYSTFPRGIRTDEYEQDGQHFDFPGRNARSKYQGMARDRSTRQMYERLARYTDE